MRAIIILALADVDLTELYTLQLSSLIRGKKREIDGFAATIAETIRNEVSLLRPGEIIGSSAPGRAWAFYIRTVDEREDEASEKGIVYTWAVDESEYLRPEKLLIRLEKELSKIFEHCLRKFASYGNARKILLLEPHWMLLADTDWWKEIFVDKSPPSIVDEIWSGR